jgi:hypothetical protein
MQDPQPDEALELKLSSSVAATLRTIDVGDCAGLHCMDFVGNCAQLRCLWMPGLSHVSDLSPLGARSETLEELWMAGNDQIDSLAALKACTKLRKLDLRFCDFDSDHVEDVQLACPLLADPESVEIEGLVHDLQPNIPAGIQEATAREVVDKIHEGGLAAQTAIAAACAVPALVQLLLDPDSSSGIKTEAAGALGSLAKEHSQNAAAITAAGGIPALERLRGHEFPADVQAAAASALRNLPDYSDSDRSQ